MITDTVPTATRRPIAEDTGTVTTAMALQLRWVSASSANWPSRWPRKAMALPAVTNAAITRRRRHGLLALLPLSDSSIPPKQQKGRREDFRGVLVLQGQRNSTPPTKSHLEPAHADFRLVAFAPRASG